MSVVFALHAFKCHGGRSGFEAYEMFLVFCNSWYVDRAVNERLFQLTSWNIDRECACGEEICIQLPSYHRLAADKTIILCLSSLILKQ